MPVHTNFLGRFAAANGGACASASGSSLDHGKWRDKRSSNWLKLQLRTLGARWRLLPRRDRSWAVCRENLSREWCSFRCRTPYRAA